MTKRGALRYLSRALALALGVGILAAWIHHAGWAQFGRIIKRTSPAWLAAALAVYAASWFFRTWRLARLTAAAGPKITPWVLFKLHVSGYALNTLLPAKLGDVATIGYLKLKGTPIGPAAAIVVQTRLLDLLALVLLAVPAVLSGRGASIGWARTALLVSAVAVLAPILVTVFDSRQRLSRLFTRLGDAMGGFLKFAAEKATDAYEGYHKMVRDRRLLAVSVGLSLVIWLLDGLTCYMVTIATDTTIGAGVVILAIALANVGKTIPATPGSVGIYESILAGVLVLFGVASDVAIAIAILDHVIKKAFTLGVGLPATATLGVTLEQIQDLARRRGRETPNEATD